MSRTAPPVSLTDARTWRRVLAHLHPDAGGSEDLFVFATAAREAICAGAAADPGRDTDRDGYRAPGEGPTRVPFPGEAATDFDALTDRALRLAKELPDPHARLLRLLAGCGPRPEHRTQERLGATYKTLAAVAHAAGMTKQERNVWYRAAELVPLSSRHSAWILDRLKGGTA